MCPYARFGGIVTQCPVRSVPAARLIRKPSGQRPVHVTVRNRVTVQMSGMQVGAAVDAARLRHKRRNGDGPSDGA